MDSLQPSNPQFSQNLLSVTNVFVDAPLQRWVCRTVGPKLAALLELIAHCWYGTNLFISLLYRYYCDSYLFELHELYPLSYSFWKFICHMIFLTPFWDVRGFSVNDFFSCTLRLCNSFPAELFSLVNDPNWF